MFSNQKEQKQREKKDVYIVEHLKAVANKEVENAIVQCKQLNPSFSEEEAKKDVAGFLRTYATETIGNYKVTLQYKYYKNNRTNQWTFGFDNFIYYKHNSSLQSKSSGGWKIHISISQEDEDKFNIGMESITKILMGTNVCSFKIIRDYSVTLQPKETQKSKQITIYYETDTGKDWTSIVSGIEKSLSDNKIKADVKNITKDGTPIDKIISEHVTLRNELLPEKYYEEVMRDHQEFYEENGLPEDYLPAPIAFKINPKKPYNVFNLPEPQLSEQKEVSDKQKESYSKTF